MANTIKKVKTKSSIDINDYVNAETGEYLTSELGKSGKITQVSEDSKYVIIQSDDYTVIDCDAMRYLASVLNRSEIGSIVIMNTDLKTPINLVFNNNMPHTNDTLQKALGYVSKAMFLNLIKKLIKLGILYQIKGNIMGEVRVVYMMNPLLARKRKQLDSKVFEVFKELRV